MAKKNKSAKSVVSNHVAVSTASAPPITPPGDLPPATGVPATPTGWEPTPKKRTSARGLRPRGAQVTDAAAAAKELSESPTYASDLGPHAPPADQVAFMMTNAAEWRDTWQAATKYLAYCSEQRATWENASLAQMDTLKPAFEYLEQRDPKAAEKYPATTKYLGAGSAITTRAAEKRKKKDSAAVKAAKAATPAVNAAAAKSLN
jgi:hypothetical protein